MKKVLLLCLFGLGMMVQSDGCCSWLFGCCSGKSDVSIEGINQTGYPIINSEAQEIIMQQIIEHYDYQQQMMDYYHKQQQILANTVSDQAKLIAEFSADLRDQRQAILDLLRETRDLENRLKHGKYAQTDRRALKRSSRSFSNKTH
jgi:hypothetical protein